MEGWLTHFRAAPLLAACFGASVIVGAVSARAENNVIVESVNDYTLMCGGSHDCDTICHQESTNFWNYLSGSYFNAYQYSPDNAVYDRHFHDPDRTGIPADMDTYAFDRNGHAISFTCLHGTCDDALTTACTSSANCAAG
jgi:hypothetical protein